MRKDVSIFTKISIKKTRPSPWNSVKSRTDTLMVRWRCTVKQIYYFPPGSHFLVYRTVWYSKKKKSTEIHYLSNSFFVLTSYLYVLKFWEFKHSNENFIIWFFESLFCNSMFLRTLTTSFHCWIK